ncbi:MAG: hypothetical protein JEZ00_08490 [Anaerolineaceae bacterium]|nr:hypothetical protein [Anaerolineaceae bacterium]
MKSPVSTAIAIGVGFMVLLGTILPIPILSSIREALVNWAVIIAGVGALVAIVHFVRLHIRKVSQTRERDGYSFLLIIAFMGTFLFGVFYTPADIYFRPIVTSILMPIETSLLALLAFSLALAVFQVVRKRRGFSTLLFLISLIFFLLYFSNGLPVQSQIPALRQGLLFLERLPIAGARGLILGIALGSLVTGIRILLGMDRPYQG